MYSKLQRKQNDLTPAQRAELDAEMTTAFKEYHSGFDNHIFGTAIVGKDSKYASDLIDDALALCGDPWHTVSRTRWNTKALAFLALFKKRVRFFVKTWKCGNYGVAEYNSNAS